MSFNLSKKKEADVIGYQFESRSVPFIGDQSTFTPLKVPLVFDDDHQDTGEKVDLVPKITLKEDDKVAWQTSKHGFFETTLTNGLKVVLYQTTAQPSVQVQTVYHFGSNDEIGPKERGLAHICEHMIFKGTKNDSNLYLSETEIPEIARMMGASYNAFTSTNITSYHFNSAPEYSEAFLTILAASMFDTKLDEQHLKSEKLAVLAEMSNGKDSVFRDALIHIRQNMYNKNIPQYYPTIGNIDDISKLDATTLRSFYNRLYHPRNATLFVVGNMTDEDLKKYKETTIQKLFSTNIPIHNEENNEIIGTPFTFVPKNGESFQKPFHTLAENEGFMLFTFPLKGMSEDIHSRKAFNAIDTIMFDGVESRLYKSLIQKAELGVTSIGGFAQLDKDITEYHIVIQGTNAIQQNEQLIKDTIIHAFLTPISGKEIQKCTNVLSFATANERTNVASLTSKWIEDYNLTKVASSYWDTTKNWIQSAKDRMLEIQQVYANDNTWSVSYRSCTKSEGEEIKQKLVSSTTKYTNILNDDNHRRTADLDIINKNSSINVFKQWSNNLKIIPPIVPIESSQGNWKYLSSPDFQLIKIAVRPRNHKKLHSTIDGAQLSFLTDVYKEIFPQERFALLGLRGVFSPSIAVCATYSRNANDRCDAFSDWVAKFASPLNVEDQKLIGTHFEENRDKFTAKWTEANASRRLDAETKVFEHIRQNCSDEYYVTGFADTFDQTDHTIQNFDLNRALSLWNEYWSETEQIMTHHEESKCELQSSVETNLETYEPEPRHVVLKVHDMLSLKANQNSQLNQSVVAIARRGENGMNQCNTDYFGLRSIANIILFHSLGSRLFKLREKKGMFYSASGAFSSGATKKCVGFDFILAKVNPGSEEIMIKQLKKFANDEMKRDVSENELIAAKRILVNNWRKKNTESEIISNWADHSDICSETALPILPSAMIEHINSVTVEDMNVFLKRDDPFDFSVKCT